MATKRELRAGEAREHLVGADRVEGGELVEDQDRDLHAAIVAVSLAAHKWQKCPSTLDFCQWPKPHRVVALCLGRVVAFDLATPAEVFSLAWTSGGPLYEFGACAPRAGAAPTTTGFAVAAAPGLEALDAADTVIVPGYRDVFDPPPEAALAALRAAADRGARVASICTGAFALAHAGLLDGRRATTHWFSAGSARERFPRIEVEPDALYVDEGEVLTSAGLSAGIDLCLHLVRRDHGERIGARVARAMVASPHRDGGQAQFIERALPAPRRGLAGAGPRAGRSTT